MKLKFLSNILIIFLLIVGCAILTTKPALAKSYSITNDQFTIQINTDKSISVKEVLTYDFDGSFSWAEMWIPVKPPQSQSMDMTNIRAITQFSVKSADNSEVQILEQKTENEQFYAKWGYSAHNEQKTFLISYTVINAIRKYPEVAELYWKVIGPDWDIPHHSVDVTVTLPEAVNTISDLYVYGHGPLNGKSEIINTKSARFTADSVASGQFMEMRFVFPSTLIEGSAFENKSLESIQEEEAEFVAKTIRAARTQQLLLYVPAITGIIATLAIIIYCLWWYKTWKKYGKEYEFPDIPEHVWQLPSQMNPAEVNVLLKQGGEPHVTAFTATIFDLARKGFITIRDEVTMKSGLLTTKQVIKTTIARTDKSSSSLKDYEQDLLDLF